MTNINTDNSDKNVKNNTDINNDINTHNPINTHIVTTTDDDNADTKVTNDNDEMVLITIMINFRETYLIHW